MTLCTLKTFLFLINTVHCQYVLFSPNIQLSSHPIFDCLYAPISEGEFNFFGHYVTNKQMAPYCRRPDPADIEDLLVGVDNVFNMITFNQLRQQGVTSEQLLQWSAPIDIAERYEVNNESSELFYNCSSPWFGSKCQYRFLFNSSLSFSDIVQVYSMNRVNASLDDNITTCYPFIAGCNRGPWPLCLDWRQICNGVPDCMSGEDEQGCEILELTQCSADEYRCHYGGQCITRTFLRDGIQSTECLDGSDEAESNTVVYLKRNALCGEAVTFRCEERINRYSRSFPCGNGEFLHDSLLPSNGYRCTNWRNRQVSLTMFSSFEHIGDPQCEQNLRCLLLTNRIYDYNMIHDMIGKYISFEVTWDTNCKPLNESCSREWLVLPAYPIMYGYFQLLYFTNRSVEDLKINILPDLICFNASKCPALLAKVVSANIIDGLTCCRSADLIEVDEIRHFYQLTREFAYIRSECAAKSDEFSCVNSSYFYCDLSMKCLSYNRVADGFNDCGLWEDEDYPSCHLNDSNRIQCKSESHRCLLNVAMGNLHRDCEQKEDETSEYIYGIPERIAYAHICNGPHNVPSNEGNETDETNCDLWPCSNPYLNCNMQWNCLNGVDELNCPLSNCSLNEFPCVDMDSGLHYCLPFVNMLHNRTNDCINDNFIRRLYFKNETNDVSEHYYSFNQSRCIKKEHICSEESKALTLQEEVCIKRGTDGVTIDFESTVHHANSEQTSICTLKPYVNLDIGDVSRYFIPSRLGYFPTITSNISFLLDISHQKHIQKYNDTVHLQTAWHCHHGVVVHLKSANNEKACFCPPNYFGSQCQWQNQRISLTLQFKIYDILNMPAVFQFVIMLIDDTGHIMPNHEQLMYMPAHECDTKFNIYLLYPDRPKNSSINYSIRIDLFDKSTLTYWNSWYLPIPFQFMPVNRVASQLIVSPTQRQQPCTLSCGEHGRCTTYSNIDTKQFCRCDQGYSGPSCNESYRCECSNDSYCLSQSICVCPLNKFGSRCYLKRWICESAKNPCENGGICIPQDDRINSNGFICVCQEGHHGVKCQHKSNRIDIVVDDTIIAVSSSYLLHFIEAFDILTNHRYTTALKKIPYGHQSITIQYPKRFNILLVQISTNKFYLAVLREQFIPSEHILTRINSNNRCPYTRELFNDTFYNFEYLRRVKYYPLLCRQNPSLMCFYDDKLMCICDTDRFSNCLDFNHTKNYDCPGRNICYNGGRCFMNNETCPTSFVCVCTDCFYGRQCNFTTKGFIFSLDPILGYHIKPNVTIYRQPPIVKFSIGLTLIMLVSELIMGSLSIITFLGKKSREVGCGYYLLASSVSSMCMIFILTYKFWQLVLSQMAVITSRSFLQFNCVSIEILLKSCLATSEWLHACVAVERMVGVIKGARFDKTKSQRVARGVIVVVIVCCVATHLHDPIHRELVDDLDGDQQRTWCLTQYSDIVGRYNSFITLFHFLTPFGINFMSTLILIIQAARVRFKVDRNSQQSWMAHLQMKLKQHRHIILAPVMLLLLGIPRLIISFSLDCMRSPRQSWLFLIGYFLSFVPSMLTLVVFVLPSNIYKGELLRVQGNLLKKLRR